jgi:hypothetical protein
VGGFCRHLVWLLPGPAVFIGGGLIIAAVAFCGSPS